MSNAAAHAARFEPVAHHARRAGGRRAPQLARRSFGCCVDDGTRATGRCQCVIATPTNVFEHGRVWTLVTEPVPRAEFFALMLHVARAVDVRADARAVLGHAAVLSGSSRSPSVAGTIAGVLVGLALGRDVPIVGLDAVHLRVDRRVRHHLRAPAGAVLRRAAADRPPADVRLHRVPRAVRACSRAWELGAAFAAAMVAAAVMTSKRWSPGLAWKRWRIARARAQLACSRAARKPPKPRRRSRRAVPQLSPTAARAPAP